jgi:HEAT repeat protein
MQKSKALLWGPAIGIVVMLGVGAALFWWAAQSRDKKSDEDWAVELFDTDPGVRRTAAEALRDMASDLEVGPALVGALEDEDDHVRALVIETLIRMGRAGIQPAVVALRQPAARIHRAAMVVFKKLGTVGASALAKELRNEDAQVRQRAAIALAELGPKAKAAVPALISALRDPDPGVRRMAASALGEIGPDARRAVPALKNALKDENAQVEKDAAAALEKIAKGAGPPKEGS